MAHILQLEVTPVKSYSKYKKIKERFFVFKGSAVLRLENINKK
jgi:hypothetical protein